METVLKTVGLSKKYGSRYVVRGVNMTINKGDIYGFIGKNGAGKTTFMRVILGLSEPTEGSFELFGGHFPRRSGQKNRRADRSARHIPELHGKGEHEAFCIAQRCGREQH